MSASPLTSRKRVALALDHCEPDRVPYDLGGTIVTGIHRIAYERLRKHLGLLETKTEIEDPIQQLAVVEEDIKQRLLVDIYGVKPSKPRGIENPPRTEGGYHKLLDEWGVEWWMPVDGGLYFDMMRHPLSEAQEIADVERYRFPNPLNPERFVGMAEQANDLLNRKQVAYALGRNSPGMFEISLWLRGFENFYCDMLVNVPMAEAVLDRVLEVKMAYWKRALEVVGENVMIVTEADDLAGQDQCLVNPEVYRKLIKPRHTKLFSFIRKQAKAPVKIFYHSCGALLEIIPDLIESGIDILNPVQVSSPGMDTKELKRRFGKDLTFWGGGVDTQKILPRGTPQQVRDEVRRRVDDLAPGGGFVFNTVHNCQPDVPPENFMAMWETLQEFGVY